MLEVILALVLFVGAAAVISGGMTASVAAVERMKSTTHGANLAVSVFSELQMGLHPFQSSGPTSFDAPFEAWNWEIQVTPEGTGSETLLPLWSVEVIIRHESEPLTCRMKQVLPGWTNQPSASLEAEWPTGEEMMEEAFLFP